MSSYTINYEDERFVEVENQKEQALSALNKEYDTLISESDKFYQDQIDASKAWEETQKKNQQEQTDFAIEKVEQQKEQAQKDYTKEQSGAYVDWQKQSGDYGVNAEKMAAQGMTGTGYAESSQVSMYNTYQNRVATAREAYSRAILNYDNAIKDAVLQNNALLAEIAQKALEEQLAIALEGFQYKNTLILAKTEAVRETEQNYYNRYQDVLDQINTENALAEQIRQFNESIALQRAQLARSSSGSKSSKSSDDDSDDSSPDTTIQKTPSVQTGYNLGELLDASSAGMSKAQIEAELKKKGVDPNNEYVQADIKWAMSK